MGPSLFARLRSAGAAPTIKYRGGCNLLRRQAGLVVAPSGKPPPPFPTLQAVESKCATLRAVAAATAQDPGSAVKQQPSLFPTCAPQCTHSSCRAPQSSHSSPSNVARSVACSHFHPVRKPLGDWLGARRYRAAAAMAGGDGGTGIACGRQPLGGSKTKCASRICKTKPLGWLACLEAYCAAERGQN